MIDKNKYPNIARMVPTTCVASKVVLSMRTVSGIYRRHLKKHGITQSQLGILMMVGFKQKMPQAELGRIMKLDRSTVTRDLKRLLERGYLKREGAVNKLDLEITEEGMVYLETILPDWENATQEANEILGEDGEAALNLVLGKFSGTC